MVRIRIRFILILILLFKAQQLSSWIVIHFQMIHVEQVLLRNEIYWGQKLKIYALGIITWEVLQAEKVAEAAYKVVREEVKIWKRDWRGVTAAKYRWKTVSYINMTVSARQKCLYWMLDRPCKVVCCILNNIIVYSITNIWVKSGCFSHI